MSSLDDLVRDTLAARACDVDGVTLTTTPPPPRSGRRWVAVGTVAAVAAAILVAVVLVAPWRDTSDRNATPPATTPPAGMQWVSYHGITLTVPDSWGTTTSPCPRTSAEPGLVSIDLPAYRVPCPSGPARTGVNQPATQLVTLAELGDQALRGGMTTIAGHPAYRGDGTLQSDPPFVVTSLQLIDVDVSIDLTGRSEAEVQSIVDTIEYTPVDHLGCAASLAHLEPTDSGPVLGVSSGAVCEYTSEKFGLTLIGSRLLSPAELTVVTGSPSPAAGSSSGLGADRGALVYRLTLTDGSTRDLAVPVDESETRLPRAYPN